MSVASWMNGSVLPAIAAVPRHLRVRYTAVDTDNRPVGATASGFHAGVVQHEFDHLDGILYPMRMTDFSLFGFNEELARVAAAAPPAAPPTAKP